MQLRTSRAPACRPRPCARAARRGRRGGRRACTARGATRRAAPRRRAGRSSSAAVAGVVDLAREVLEEAVELVEVAVGDRQERGRVGRRRRARSRARRPAARRGSARRGPATRTRSPRSKRPAEQVGVAEHARRAARPCGRAARARGRACRCARVSRSLRVQAKTPSTSSPARSGAELGRGHASDDGGRARTDPLPWTAMQPLRWERRPDGLRAPALVCAFKGWNDAGESATSALTFLGAGLGAERFARDRPRGVRRLPGDAPDGAARRRASRATIDWPEHRDLRGPHPARAARPDPALRPRARDPLAHVLRDGDRPRRGARRPDGRHARRAAGRRPALAPGRASPRIASDDALVERLGARAADLRGPDRDRRRPARRVRGRRACRPRRCGRRCRTTSRSCRTRRARWRCCAGSRSSSASPSTPPSSRTPPAEYERQVSRAVEMDPDVQAFVERLERAADEEEGRPDPGAAAVRRRARARVPALPAPARPSSSPTPSGAARRSRVAGLAADRGAAPAPGSRDGEAQSPQRSAGGQ